jgi:hypothetical protein
MLPRSIKIGFFFQHSLQEVDGCDAIFATIQTGHENFAPSKTVQVEPPEVTCHDTNYPNLLLLEKL